MNINEVLKQFVHQYLIEASLNRAVLNKRPWRYNRFIEFIQSGKTFKVGDKAPYVDAVVTLQIADKKKKSIMSPSSDLTNKAELAAFEDWMQKGDSSKFSVLPVVNGKPISWTKLYKDPENFQYETAAAGSIPEKALTPSSLGVAGKPINAKNTAVFKSAVAGFEGNLSKILTGLIDAASRGGAIPENVSALLAELDEGDKKKIVKDFGEILAAIMVAKQEGFTEIEFPAGVSNPLTDFSLIRGKGATKEVAQFSAKGLSGSAASMKNYLENLLKIKNATPEQKAAIEAFTATQDMSLHNTVLYLAQSPVFAKSSVVQDTLSKMKKAVGVSERAKGILTDDALLELVMKSPNPKKTLKTYYSYGLPASPKGNLDDVLKVGLSADLIKSLMIYPLMKAIMSEMNAEDSVFKKVFAKSVNQTNAAQAFINFDNFKKPKTLLVSVKPFEGVKPESIAFKSKAGATTFKQGGIGVAIKN